jgi:isopenicillin N synthase-like dioxygenase
MTDSLRNPSERPALRNIPTVSLAPMYGNDHAARRDLAHWLDEVCRQVGFLVVNDHGVDSELLDAAFNTSEAFFTTAQAAKDEWHPTGPAKQRGYHGYATRGLAATLGRDAPPDMRESLFFGPVEDHRQHFAGVRDAHSVYAPNIYPAAPADLSPTIISLYHEFETFSAQLLSVMAQALGAPRDFFANKVGRHFSILACHFYPPPAAHPLPGQLRAGEHTDFGAFTVLAMTQAAGGLEARLPDGKWHPVQTEPGQLVVNLGDMMARWTNDRWVSTLHRVVPPLARGASRVQRQSIGYFMHPDYDAPVECLPSVLAEGEIAKYEPITAGDHIRAKIESSHTA